MKNSLSLIARTALATAVVVGSGSVWAAVSADEAAKLKSTLTPMGAEKSGNKDGSIPAWDGGFSKVPAGYKQGQPRPDFFASEKPLYSVTSKNIDQYADKLSEVTKAMLKKHPDYRLDVYPTHRTASAPQLVYDNIFKNATRAKTFQEGDSIEGAFGGIPFPIPKDGSEAMWNSRMAWAGEDAQGQYTTWVVTGQGKRIMATKYDEWFANPYYYKDGAASNFDGQYYKTKVLTLEPASKAGEALLAWQAFESEKGSAWQYLVGQRRVRRSPSVGYDTPNFITSGIGLFDEAFGAAGALSRHNLKLVGKQEMLVPYNNNKAAAASPEELVQPNFLNPSLVRWELHRVWVVEATLREGKRHVVPKRTYYLDEDTWCVLLTDGWDAKGSLWRGYFSLTLLAPDIPALLGNLVNWGGYNVQTGEYYLSVSTLGSPRQYEVTSRRPPEFFSPDSLTEGAR
ncbi:DUF1329 domain-containing protein [Ideonella azotifigens]|uniref:DUF1329 domain-containing protein n=1 Tax=Ideonella azotifigens TaxID=513160 RepID=A0ABP3VWG7_9BURK|nr:DUF1329 domain-containing protein [Ideonella azotifigens]MCD2344971.1 DUF1329 domain-containing protein [Ideonella azotifigens]